MAELHSGASYARLERVPLVVGLVRQVEAERVAALEIRRRFLNPAARSLLLCR